MDVVEAKYMERCITLAAGGIASVAPNPMVGSVIVHNGRIIGEGFHRNYGGPHAEVHAITSVKEEKLLKNSTLYVNLEPCSHHGKTPPCAELIIRKGIPRVVVGCPDPYPEVSGKGIEMLRSAGVDVITGILEEESWNLNKIFMTSHTYNRPYICLKWAQSMDGFIDRVREDCSTPAVRLSSPEQQQRVHKLRSEFAAILVGTKTALLDNPSLNVRYWSGVSPVRVVLDRNLVIPSYYHLLDGIVETLIFTAMEARGDTNPEYIKIDFNNDVIKQILDHLYQRKLYSLLVEGGANLLNQFFQTGLWDEIQVETAPVYLGEGVVAPMTGH